jgi:DNA/RNA-binding domain of Phe-tRNA-synthetase-like protein
MNAPLAAAEAAVRMSPPSETTAVRTMYKRVGLDPTRNRPSSEALLRRVRRGDPLPRINSMVDVCNWCSLEFQLPYGLYDAARLEGDVELRRGRDGECYARTRYTSTGASRLRMVAAPSATRRRIRRARW